MTIILANKLAKELRAVIPNRKVAALSTEDSKLQLKAMKKISDRAEEDLGLLAYVSYNGRSLGMVAARPILPIITSKKPLELSGFCFRNCQRVLVFDIFGGRALLQNIYPPPFPTSVQLKSMGAKNSRPLANIEKPGHIYNFNLYDGPTPASRKLFGHLEVHPAFENASLDFTFLPIWRDIPQEQLMDEIKGERLFLKGILYHLTAPIHGHCSFIDWVNEKYALLP